MTITLTDEQAQLLLGTLRATTDKGPHEAGWKSDELSALVENLEAQIANGSAKPYALFAAYYYYPEGGADDFIQLGESIEALQAVLESSAPKWDWGHIVKTETMEIVWES